MNPSRFQCLHNVALPQFQHLTDRETPPGDLTDYETPPGDLTDCETPPRDLTDPDTPPGDLTWVL